MRGRGESRKGSATDNPLMAAATFPLDFQVRCPIVHAACRCRHYYMHTRPIPIGCCLIRTSLCSTSRYIISCVCRTTNTTKDACVMHGCGRWTMCCYFLCFTSFAWSGAADQHCTSFYTLHYIGCLMHAYAWMHAAGHHILLHMHRACIASDGTRTSTYPLDLFHARMWV